MGAVKKIKEAGQKAVKTMKKIINAIKKDKIIFFMTNPPICRVRRKSFSPSAHVLRSFSAETRRFHSRLSRTYRQVPAS